MVWWGGVWCGVVWWGGVWCGVVWCGVTKFCSQLPFHQLKEKCLREVEVDKQGFGGTRAVECLKKHMLGDEKFRTQHTQCFNVRMSH